MFVVKLSEDASGHSESASRQQQSKVEDILVKMIRLVANVSISADIGQQLACTDSLLELLMDVISTSSLLLHFFVSYSLTVQYMYIDAIEGHTAC